MSLISHNQLIELITLDIIQNVASLDQVNSSSIDVRLGPRLLIETQAGEWVEKSVIDKDSLETDEVILEEGHVYSLKPGEFILAHSIEMFNLPRNISAEYKLKSSMARLGLEHLNAGWCDAGWHGSVLTLELKNITRFHTIQLECGMRIGQVVFFEHELVPEGKDYGSRGSYNNIPTVQGVLKLEPIGPVGMIGIIEPNIELEDACPDCGSVSKCKPGCPSYI